MNTKKIILVFGVATLWAGSLAATYFHTREKWLDLGRYSGTTGGKGEVLYELCAHATTEKPEQPVVWSLGVKASIVELSGENGQHTLYCN